MTKKRKSKRISLGFTLMELLVVMGILAIIIGITLIAVNPAEQINKSSDIRRQAIATDFVKANVAYFATEKQLPWEKNEDCLNEINAGGSLAEMPNCLGELIGGGKLQEVVMENQEFEDVQVNQCGNTAVVCYNPRSKEQYEQATYNKFGVNRPGCPGTNGTSSECYWCKPVMDTPSCEENPDNDNPWGQALTFNGKVGGQNPPSYNWISEYIHVPYDSRMDLSSPNVTVEAWIKPDVPTAAGYDYRIVDNTYKLTMDARPNGSNISYRYYFDVQSATNGCGRTVVYSHSTNWYPWEGNNTVDITVTPEAFATWKHVAGVLENGNLHVYENGIKLSSYTIGMTVCNDSREFYVGTGDNGPMWGEPWYYNFFQGAIDEVRISTIARYTSNFTPANLPFTPDTDTLMLFHFDGNTNDASANAFSGAITGDVPYVTSDIPID